MKSEECKTLRVIQGNVTVSGAIQPHSLRHSELNALDMEYPE